MIILDKGREALMHLIGGDLDMVAKGVYLEYSNNGGFSPPEVTPDRDRQYYEDLEGDEGYIRAIGLSNPLVANVEGDVEAIFTALSNGEVINGPGLTDTISRVYAAALVAMPDPEDRTKDVVLFAGNMDEPVVKPANAQISTRISITLPGEEESTE